MTSALDGDAISRILTSEGPIVKCVLIKAPLSEVSVEDENSAAQPETNSEDVPETTNDSKDTKSHPAPNEDEKKPAKLNGNADTSKTDSEQEALLSSAPTETTGCPSSSSSSITYIPADRISEITIDTTPKKRQVESVLGGPFTFLGQYEKEGVVVIVRRECDIANNIKLPRPLDKVEVKGDVLLMKVADEEDEGEVEGEDENGKEKEDKPEKDFFVDFAKTDFLNLLKRKEEEPSNDEQDDEESEEDEEQSEEEEGEATEDVENIESNECDDEDSDEEVGMEDFEEMDEDEEKIGMMNLCMGQILRKFHEEKDRGPDTTELLELRKALALKLGVEVPPLDEDEEDKKRGREDDSGDEEDEPYRKKIRFSNVNEEREIPRICRDEESDDDYESDEINNDDDEIEPDEQEI